MTATIDTWNRPVMSEPTRFTRINTTAIERAMASIDIGRSPPTT